MLLRMGIFLLVLALVISPPLEAISTHDQDPDAAPLLRERPDVGHLRAAAMTQALALHPPRSGPHAAAGPRVALPALVSPPTDPAPLPGCEPLRDPLTLALRAPIAIHGDQDFTSFQGVVLGSGTATDPYIIEGWNIMFSPGIMGIKLLEADSEAGILIENTNAFVIVRDVAVGTGLPIPIPSAVTDVGVDPSRFFSTGYTVGIQLRNAHHVLLERVRVSRSDDTGIAFQGSVDAELRCSLLVNNGSAVGDFYEEFLDGHMAIVRNYFLSNYAVGDFWEGSRTRTGTWDFIDNVADHQDGFNVWDYLGSVEMNFLRNKFDDPSFSAISLWYDFYGQSTVVVQGNAVAQRTARSFGIELWGDFRAAANVVLDNNTITGLIPGVQGLPSYSMDVWGNFLAGGTLQITTNQASGTANEAINDWGDWPAGGTILVSDNVVSATGYEGLALWGRLFAGAQVVVERNDVHDAGQGLAIYSQISASSLIVRNNTGLNNRWWGLLLSLRLSNGATVVVEDNVARGNGFTNSQRGNVSCGSAPSTPLWPGAGGIDLQLSAPAGTSAVVRANRLENNRYGVAVLGMNTCPFGVHPANLAQIHDNTITGNQVGVYIHKDPSYLQPLPTMRNNKISGNTLFGVQNEYDSPVDAVDNWWGHASGPGGAGPGSGDHVTASVTYTPWLSAAP